MPLSAKKISSERTQFRGSLSTSEIKGLVKDQDLRVLQTTEPTDTKTWSLLNDEFFSQRSDVELRVYGFYSSTCDLSFLAQVRNVRHFSADCLMKAVNIEALEALEGLKSLSVGIYNLADFNFLRIIPGDLRKLFLGVTKSKRPSIPLLDRFQKLETLYIEAQQKHIEALAELKSLEKLTLRSIRQTNLAFLAKLQSLHSLEIKLGGLSDLSALSELTKIKYLELWQVRKLEGINFISSMEGLQHLFLQSLPNISRLPDLSKLTQLRRIYLENMKGLKDIREIATAPELEEFIHVNARGMNPEMYASILTNPSLKKAGVWFGSEKKNSAFLDMIAELRIEPYKHTDFVFQ